MVNWGETEIEEELDVRSWLLEDAAKDATDTKMKEARKKSMTSGRTGVETMVMKNIKQLELNWRKHMSK